MDDGPQDALERLAAHGRRGFPNLLEARERTARDLAAMQRRLEPVALDADVSVVLMGSWGRRERTEGSDDDYLVLVDGEARHDARPRIADLEGVLGAGAAKPGTQEVFGRQVAVGPLVRHIGLEDDANSNLTRRMLLVLESLPVVGRDAYRDAFERIVAGYLAGHAKDFRPPRFLLNDLIRYWRTICVDFAGKAREGDDKWGLRNAKLRLNRKVLFAGGLVPVLLCHELRASAQQAFVVEQLQVPPTDRLAHAFLRFDAVDPGLRALGAYDRWIGMLGDPEVRAHLETLAPGQVREDRTFGDVRRLATEFEHGLLSLLFDTPLGPIVREFGIF